MADPFEQFHSLYEKGLAVGHRAIRTDAIDFTYRGEVFEVPGIAAHRVAKWNGYFFTAPVEKLRELKTE